MGDDVRALVVVRHAKSAWPAGVPDRERPLGERGLRDAPVMGDRIRALVGGVDVVVLSPTRRTRQTWDLLGAALGHQGTVRTDDRVYDAWGRELMDVVTGLPEDAGTALIVGHEPGLSELVLKLSAYGDPALRDRVATKFPTCAVAVLRIPSTWAVVTPGCAELTAFTTPKR